MLRVLVVGLACVVVLGLTSAAGAQSAADDTMAGIAASNAAPGWHGSLMTRLVDKALLRFVTKTPPDYGAVPPAWESTSPTYLPEISINRPVPRGLAKVLVWQGIF